MSDLLKLSGGGLDLDVVRTWPAGRRRLAKQLGDAVAAKLALLDARETLAARRAAVVARQAALKTEASALVELHDALDREQSQRQAAFDAADAEVRRLREALAVSAEPKEGK
jgi:glycosyltransferase A (GT-A) superfamily protein (DUF2064 family)